MHATTVEPRPAAALPVETVSVDNVTEREWNDIIRLFDDASVYQTWAYGAVRWGEKQLSHLVLRRNGEILAAAQLRVVQVPVLRKGVAYLRWGPLWRRRGCEVTPEVVQKMTQALLNEYVERRGLLFRVIPVSYRGDATSQIIETLWPQCGLTVDPDVRAYHTFRLDLSPSLEAIRKGFGAKWRNKLNGAERDDLTIVEGTDDDLIKTLLPIHHEMATRKHLAATVDVEEFARVQRLLPEALKMRTFLCQKNGQTLSAAVVTPCGDSAIYLLGATSNAGMNAKGSYLLQWRAIQYLKERGTRWYDLGGINPDRNPGVYEFKKGLSGGEERFLGRFSCSRSSLSSLLVRAGERLAAWRRPNGETDTLPAAKD